MAVFLFSQYLLNSKDSSFDSLSDRMLFVFLSNFVLCDTNDSFKRNNVSLTNFFHTALQFRTFRCHFIPERIRPKCIKSTGLFAGHVSLSRNPLLHFLLSMYCSVVLLEGPVVSKLYLRATGSTSLMMIENAFFKQNKERNAL